MFSAVWHAAIVLSCLAVWVGGFTGLLILADNASRKGEER